MLRSDPSEAAPLAAASAVGGAPGKDCKAAYKTKATIDYCEGQKEKEVQNQIAALNGKNLGIFGDSGAVSYGSGVEDLLATAFGAKRQNKPIGEANIGEFASEVGEAAKTAVLGK